MRAGRKKTRSGNSIQFPFKLVFFGELNFNIWSFRLNIWNHVWLWAFGQASMNSLCCSRFHKQKKFMAIYEAQHPLVRVTRWTFINNRSVERMTDRRELVKAGGSNVDKCRWHLASSRIVRAEAEKFIKKSPPTCDSSSGCSECGTESHPDGRHLNSVIGAWEKWFANKSIFCLAAKLPLLPPAQ